MNKFKNNFLEKSKRIKLSKDFITLHKKKKNPKDKVTNDEMNSTNMLTLSSDDLNNVEPTTLKEKTINEEIKDKISLDVLDTKEQKEDIIAKEQNLSSVKETNEKTSLDKDNLSKKIKNNEEDSSFINEIDSDTLRAKKLIEEQNMDVIEALDHLDKLDEEKDNVPMSKGKKKIKDYLDKKLIPVCICFFITMMLSVSAILISMSTLKVSIIVDDDDPVTIKQIGTLTTADALTKAKITPSSTDTISKSLDENLKNNDVIKITTASKVLVTDGDEIVKVDTGLTDEKDIIEQAGFDVKNGQNISSIEHKKTSVYAVLDENQKLVNKSEKIKYKTIYKEVDTLDGEDEKVVQKGRNGKVNYISVVTTDENGDVVKTKNLTKTVETKAQNKIVEVAKDSDELIILPNSEGNAPVEYNQKVTVEVTAYCSCAICCGKSTGMTASGTHATAGRTIAAWSGLPFGTKVYFPALSGNSNGGVYVVEDRGGAISSGRIDIYFDSHSAALSFGRRTMEAYILK